MVVMRNAYKILFGKCQGKKLFRILRHGWKDDIKMDLRKTGCEVVELKGTSVRIL
jgi:hypothetical protein